MRSVSTSRLFRTQVGAVVAVSSLLLAGCGSSSESTKAESEPAAGGSGGPVETAGSIETEQDGSGAIERIDVNGDKKADVFKFYRVLSGQGADAKKVLIRKEMDVNFDQKIDIVQYFAGDAGKEVLVREEMDLDFDGRVDETRHYKDGYKYLVELDLGFDGRTDTWRYYQKTQTEDGKSVVRLVEKRRDTNGDGTVDVWEYFVAGSLVKIGYDTNGDGSPDRFTKVGKK
ncbi:MAG: hypothetical protein RIT45_3798 [Pseudomonadota bacterium]|jgi:hypothetical protein